MKSYFAELDTDKLLANIENSRAKLDLARVKLTEAMASLR